MGKNRLEAFSDGVLAIIITIMVLEIKAPHEASLAALSHVWPVFLSYVLSFIYVGIYWNNHHHLLHTLKRVTGGILWANLHLLFWLSLIPFATAWMGENHFAAAPSAVYGVVLLMAGTAYYGLERCIIATHGGDEAVLSKAMGRGGLKEMVSIVGYAAAIALAFTVNGLSLLIYAGLALMWLVPDRRIERALDRE